MMGKIDNIYDKIVMEIASEEQEVLIEYVDRPIYKSGIMEGLRLARIIVREIREEDKSKRKKNVGMNELL